MAYNSNAGSQMNKGLVMDPYYGCYRWNGVLYPQPIQSLPLEPSPPPLQQEATPDMQQEQLGMSGERTPRKRRDLTASRVVETRQFSLVLLKTEQEYKYMLEMHEVTTGNTAYYMLLPYEKLGKKKIEAKEVLLERRVVSPMTNETCLNSKCKYNLSMKERLEGVWTTEVRERTGTTKTEKFYSHKKVNKTFRSFNDVVTYIIYGVIY